MIWTMRVEAIMTTDELRKDMHNKVKEILTQVKWTNGRVSKLESWKDQVSGAIKILLIVAALLAFLFKMGWLRIG